MIEDIQEMDKAQAPLAIKRAIETRSDEALFKALLDVFSQQPMREVVPDLCKLLLEEWHEQHEDVALLLQELKDKRAVEPLYTAAQKQFDHLIRWNNLQEFQRKCTWALADIGNDQAKKRLGDLCNCSDENLVGYAKERLDNWDSELNRKGMIS